MNPEEKIPVQTQSGKAGFAYLDEIWVRSPHQFNRVYLYDAVYEAQCVAQGIPYQDTGPFDLRATYTDDSGAVYLCRYHRYLASNKDDAQQRVVVDVGVVEGVRFRTHVAEDVETGKLRFDHDSFDRNEDFIWPQQITLQGQVYGLHAGYKSRAKWDCADYFVGSAPPFIDMIYDKYDKLTKVEG